MVNPVAVRECPFDDCDKLIPSSMFACLKHWRRMDRCDKTRISCAWEAYKAGRITLTELTDIQCSVMRSYRTQLFDGGGDCI